MATQPVVRHVIEIKIGGDYMKDLRARMKAQNVSQGELARQMKLSASQVNRWFTKSERAVMPTLDTIQKIERAMLSIALRRNKDGDAR